MGFRVNAFSLMGLRTVSRQIRQSDGSSMSLASQPTSAKDLSTKFAKQLTSSIDLTSLNDRANRNFSTDGIGNRAFGVTSPEPSDALKLNHPLGAILEADTSTFNAEAPVTQNDLTQIRQSMETVIANYALQNPSNVSTETLTAEVDRYFGSGTSDLFKIRVVDLKAGKTQVEFNNIETKNLTPTEKVTLVTASQNAKKNFSKAMDQRSLEGADVDRVVSKINDLFDYRATLVLSDFKSSLEKPGSFVKSANKLLDDSKDFLNENDRVKLKAHLEELKALDDQNAESFNANPLADDLRVQFTSNRYGPAWDSATIERNAALTQTPGWTTNTRLNITGRNRNRYSG